MNQVRISKYFTDCGVLSRRAAEEEIRKGNVTVNGSTALLGQKIDPETDVVLYRGKPLRAPANKQYHYILLNKPRGYVTTLSDEKGRPTVAELVRNVGARVYPVGRLDMDSDGLLLFTDDGDLTNRLTHPSHDIPKIYLVAVAGRITEQQLETLRSPIELDGYRIRPVGVDLVRADNQTTVLRMTLFEGRNRQIRKMCEIADLKVRSLTRVAIGAIKLGDLPSGSWRELSKKEILLLGGHPASRPSNG